MQILRIDNTPLLWYNVTNVNMGGECYDKSRIVYSI